MIKWEFKCNLFFFYYVGEIVFVCVVKMKKIVKGKKIILRGICEGLILKVDYDLYRYYVDFEDLNIVKKKVWVKVDYIILVIKEEGKWR